MSRSYDVWKGAKNYRSAVGKTFKAGGSSGGYGNKGYGREKEERPPLFDWVIEFPDVEDENIKFNGRIKEFRRRAWFHLNKVKPPLVNDDGTVRSEGNSWNMPLTTSQCMTFASNAATVVKMMKEGEKRLEASGLTQEAEKDEIRRLVEEAMAGGMKKKSAKKGKVSKDALKLKERKALVNARIEKKARKLVKKMGKSVKESKTKKINARKGKAALPVESDMEENAEEEEEAEKMKVLGVEHSGSGLSSSDDDDDDEMSDDDDVDDEDGTDSEEASEDEEEAAERERQLAAKRKALRQKKRGAGKPPAKSSLSAVVAETTAALGASPQPATSAPKDAGGN